MPGMYAIVVVLFGLSIILLLIALGHALAVGRHWRARRHLHAAHRGAWTLVFVLAAALSAGLGVAIRSYRLLTAETPVATLTSRQLGPQQFAVRMELPDGAHRSIELRGAQPLYRLDRISGRYRDVTQAQTAPPSVVALGDDSILDLWKLKQDFPRWLPWIDADYGSGAFLPLVDGGAYSATLGTSGGLIARPADARTVEKLKATGW